MIRPEIKDRKMPECKSGEKDNKDKTVKSYQPVYLIRNQFKQMPAAPENRYSRYQQHDILGESFPISQYNSVTEAGTERMGVIKSAVGIGSLLCDGIGDTIRVSLTADPVKEIYAAKDILRACDIGTGVQIVACPTCGRTKIALIPLAEQVEKLCAGINKPIKVAVMGCVVNGPGEAREADIGIAGGNGEGILFKKGQILRKVPEDRLLEELKKEIDLL